MCAQEMTSKLTSAICDKDKMAEQVEISKENATLFINQAFEQLHQAIEERKKALFSEIGAISLSKTTALSLQKEQLVKIQDEIGRYTEMTSHILQTHTDHEVVALGDLLPTELKATLKKVEGVSLSTSDIHVTLQTDSLMKELSKFACIMASPPSPSQSTWSSKSAARMDMVYSVKVETKSSEGERYPYGGLQVKAELRSKSHDGAVVPGKVEDRGDGTYTITLCGYGEEESCYRRTGRSMMLTWRARVLCINTASCHDITWERQTGNSMYFCFLTNCDLLNRSGDSVTATV